MVNVVVLFGGVPGPSGASSLTGEAADSAAILDAAAEVNVITLGVNRPFAGVATHVNLEHEPPGILDRIFKWLGFYAVRERLSTFPIGRLLNSMGPVSQGRVFWRAVRHNSAALEVLRNADVAIAVDLEAVKTAWIALHRNWTTEAHYDHRASGYGARS